MSKENRLSYQPEEDYNAYVLNDGIPFSDQPMGYDEPVLFTPDTDPELIEIVIKGIRRVYENNRTQIRKIFEVYRNDETARTLLSQRLDEKIANALFSNEPLV